MSENHRARGATDDERPTMTTDERSVWAYLFAVVITSTTYFAVIASRLRDSAPAEVSWVAPMLWALGLSIAGTIVGTILVTIGSAIASTVRGKEPDVEQGSDERDRDIKRYGDRKTYGVLAVAMGGALALAMIDADTFWIGNYLFLLGTIGAIIETTVKIRAYRRGF